MTMATQADTRSELCELLEEVRALQASVGQNLWRMGRCLARLREHESWWMPRYGSWKAFTLAELNITGGYAYKLIDVAKNFTEKQVRDCGATKLVRILPVPAEHRGQFLREARYASASELRASVNRFTLSRASAAPAGVIPNRETGRRASSRTRKVAHVDASERVVVALYSRTPQGGVRAKRIEDSPMGRAILGRTAYTFSLRMSDQGLSLYIALEPDDG